MGVCLFVCLLLLPKEMVDYGTQEFCQQYVCVCVCVFVCFVATSTIKIQKLVSRLEVVVGLVGQQHHKCV